MNNIKTKLLFFAFMGLIIFTLVMLWRISFIQAFQWILHQYHLTDYQQSILGAYVNQSSWFKFQCFSSLLLAVIFWGLCFKRRSIKSMYASILYLIKQLFQEMRALSIMGKVMIVFVLLLSGLLLMVFSRQVYFQLDELNSWLYFVDRGMLVTMTYFPSTNNHIGYNLTSVFWNQFLGPVLAMRMTSWLSALGSIFVFYLILLKRYQMRFAFMGVFLLATLFPFIWYAVQGRAYALELFLLLLLYYVVLEKSNERLDWVFVFIAAFTIYSVSVALIPVGLLTLLYIYFMRLDVHFWKRMVHVLMTIFLLVAFLYAPVWIFSDGRLLYVNTLAKHSTYQEAPWVLISDYLPAVWQFVTGTQGALTTGLVCFLVLISTWLLFRKKYVSFVPLLLLVSIPSVLFLIYPVHLFERTWLWLCILFVYFLVDMFSQLDQHAQRVFYAIAPLFLFSWLYIHYDQGKLVLEKSRLMEAELEELKSIVCEKTIPLRIDDDILYTYFRFYQKTCRFSLCLGVDQSVAGDWSIVPPGKVNRHLRPVVVHKNLIGEVYKYE